MDIETAQIEQIVREVIRRLNGRSIEDAPKLEESELVGAADATTLVIDQRIITARVLEGRLREVRTLKVPADAVVTPLVRDLLNEASIKLTRCATRLKENATRGWLLVESDWNAARIVDRLNKNAWRQVSAWDSLLEQASARDLLRVICTPQWAARVCQANRHPAIRAAHVATVAAVHEAVQQVEANMIVIDTNQHDEPTAIEIMKCFAELSSSSYSGPNRG